MSSHAVPRIPRAQTPDGGPTTQAPRREVAGSPHVLVVARGHVADLLTALPALRDLRAAFPRSHITAVVNEFALGVLEHCPFVSEVLPGFSYGPHPAAQRSARKALLLARLAGRFDVALLMRYGPAAGPLLALLAGARIRVGYRPAGPLRRLLTHDLGAEPRDIPNRLRNLRVVHALGIPGHPGYPPIDWLPAPVRVATTALLARAGLREGERFAILQLSSDWGCNEWADSKWAPLADHLQEALGLRVLVTGRAVRADRLKFDRVQALMRTRMISLHGQTTLPRLLDLVGRAALMVGTDSALTQVALAQAIPAVVLFGIEPMVANGPLPGEVGRLLEPIQHWDGPERSPPPNPRCPLEGFGPAVSCCHDPDCRENSSLDRTPVDEVKARVERLLSTPGGATSRTSSTRGPASAPRRPGGSDLARPANQDDGDKERSRDEQPLTGQSHP